MAVNPLLSLQTRAIDLSGAGQAVARNIQFDRQQDQQQEQIDLQRRQVEGQEDKDRLESALVGAAVLDDLLESGNIEGARNYLKTRGKNLIDIGKNPNDTMEALELLEEDPERLRSITSAAKQEALRRGLIEPTDKGGFTLSPGQTRFDAMGNPITSVPDEKDTDFTARNIILPDGGRVSGRTTPEGRIEIVNERGEFERAPQGAQIISTSLQGSEEEIGATNPEIRKFRALEAKMPVVERLQERIAEGLEADEFVGGVSGSTVRLFNSFRSQVEQLHNTFNQDKPEGERDVELSVDKYQDVFEDVTNITSKVKSGILDLAYMTLKAKGEERVSDQDIRLELQSFGMDTNDPEVIMNRVNEKIGDLYANYQATARGLGMDPQFQFRERPLGGANEFGSQEAAQEAIERGDIKVGDEVIINGQRFRVQE